MEENSALFLFLNDSHTALLAFSNNFTEIKWHGYTEPIRESCGGSLPHNIGQLSKFLEEASAAKLNDHIKNFSRIETELKFNTNSENTFFCIAASPAEIFIHIIRGVDINEKLKSDNFRLQKGLAEAHHRVRNSFQNIISYINILLRNNDSLIRSDIKKLTNHIHSLSSLHSILLEEVTENVDGKLVRFDRVLNNVFSSNFNGREFHWEEISEIKTSPRKTANFCLIISEAIETAFKFGNSPVTLAIDNPETDYYIFKISTDMPDNHHDIQNLMLNDLKFANMLATTEMGKGVKIELQQKTLEINLTLTL